jgi:hypothetical protein
MEVEMATTLHPSFEHIDDPLHARLLQYWRAKRERHLVPWIEDIDFDEIPDIQRDVGLLRVLSCGLRCRVERADSAFVSAVGAPGSLLSFGGAVPLHRWCCDIAIEVATAEAPVYVEAIVLSQDDTRLWASMLMLPLDCGGEPLGAILFSSRFLPLRSAPRESSAMPMSVSGSDPFEVKRVVYRGRSTRVSGEPTPPVVHQDQ